MTGTLEGMRIARFTVDNDLHYGVVEGEDGSEVLHVLAGDPFYSGVETTLRTFACLPPLSHAPR